MARLQNIKDLKTKISNHGDIADAIGQLTEFISIVTLGLTTTGGILTVPYIIKESSKTAASLSKILKVLLDEDRQSDYSGIPAERADEIFYVLAQRAYLKSVSKIENKATKRLAFKKEQHQKLIKKIESSIVTPDIAEASFNFGWNPESGTLQLFRSYSAWLKTLLVSMGLKDDEGERLLKEVELEARKSLHSELVSQDSENKWMVHYQLLDHTSSIRDMLSGYISSQSASKEGNWKRYLDEVAIKPSLPIWGEEENGLGIEKLFVEPSYSYTRYLPDGRSAHGNPETAITLKRFLLGLLSGRRPSTELLFIMGGPGTGKTSLMEVFASDVAKTDALKIILVPAKRLNPNRAILPEVQNYLRELGHESLADILMTTKDVIIAIDGFDELAHATLSSLETFFRQAQELVRERSSLRLRIIMSGRPTLFSTNDVSIPSGSHVVSLQPFDSPRIKEWSTNWRQATKGSFEGSVYLSSSSSDLRELATQPMLLYLLAKMHEEKEAIPANYDEEGGVRYRIYCKILDWVCRRQEEKKVPTPLTVSLRRFLQVAGLATHQSGQRTLHWSNFVMALQRSGLADDATKVNSKVHSTILSFAFTSLEEKSWEFTHKSFGEALAAEAIGRVLEDISEEGRDGERWKMSLPVAAKVWVESFGPHYLSKDILDFYDGWLYTRSDIVSSRLIPRMIEIFSYLLGYMSSDAISVVSKDCEKPVCIITGNAIRSWFNLTNTALYQLVKHSGIDSLLQYEAPIQYDKYRIGVYLVQLVSPISVREGKALFQYTSRLVNGLKDQRSPRYIYSLQKMLMMTKKMFTNSNELFRYTPSEAIYHFERDPHIVQYIDNAYVDRLGDLSTYWHNIDPDSESSPMESLFSDIEDILQYVYEISIYEQAFDKAGLKGRVVKTKEEYNKIANTIRNMINEYSKSNRLQYVYLDEKKISHPASRIGPS